MVLAHSSHGDDRSVVAFRICELVSEPLKHYTRLEKYTRALEKNVNVVTTIPATELLLGEEEEEEREQEEEQFTFPPPPKVQLLISPPKIIEQQQEQQKKREEPNSATVNGVQSAEVK